MDDPLLEAGNARHGRPDDLSGRVTVITGAAGALGGVVARAFRAAGARLVLVDRAEDRLPRIFPDLVGAADHLLSTSVDLTDARAVRGMVDRAIQRFGRIDILANVAGGFRGGAPLHETSDEEWDLLFDLNARSVFTTCRAVAPYMLRQRSGRIVNVASVAAIAGAANVAVYSASKSAVVRLTESLSAELRPAGINANCVLPSTIDTPANRRAMPQADPLNWVEPEAVADVILFLASHAARAVHGAAIPVV